MDGLYLAVTQQGVKRRILGQAVHVEFGSLETAVQPAILHSDAGVDCGRFLARRACPWRLIRPSTTKATLSQSSSAVAMSWVVQEDRPATLLRAPG